MHQCKQSHPLLLHIPPGVTVRPRDMGSTSKNTAPTSSAIALASLFCSPKVCHLNRKLVRPPHALIVLRLKKRLLEVPAEGVPGGRAAVHQELMREAFPQVPQGGAQPIKIMLQGAPVGPPVQQQQVRLLYLPRCASKAAGQNPACCRLSAGPIHHQKKIENRVFSCRTVI